VSADPSLERFRAEVALGEGADLGRAAFLLALYANPALDVAAGVARLDALAGEARGRGLAAPATIASLFGAEGLRGNGDDYYDPRNSFLDQVLERRLGIPISLAVAAIEVGRRLGLEVEGVPFPGHFLVRVRDGARAALLDPFRGGVELADADLLARLAAVTGRIGSLGPAELGRASKRQILLRMLHNLKAIYIRSDQLQDALAIEQRLIALQPEDWVERRDRGLLLARLGFAAEAAADLEAYLALAGDAGDRAAVRHVLDHLDRGRRGLD
jgi:regulator of sirC expression with transglutaminase-like and TPR domain